MNDRRTFLRMIESAGVEYRVSKHYDDPELTVVKLDEDGPAMEGPGGYSVTFTFDAQGKFVRAGVWM